MDKVKEAGGAEPPKSANDFLAAAKYVAETHGVKLMELKFSTVDGMRCEWNIWTEEGPF